MKDFPEEKNKPTKLPAGYAHSYHEHWYNDTWFDEVPYTVKSSDIKFTYGDDK